MTTTALQSEEAVLERIHKQHLIESVEQMSPAYLVEEGPCTWDDVMARWKARGPMNEQFVGMV